MEEGSVLPLPAQRSSRDSALSRRGSQLAAATVLGAVTVLLVLGAVLLGLYEAHCQGLSAWVR